MKITVCELHDDAERLERDWQNLTGHAGEHGSELVLLPEMPFCSWFAASPDFVAATWDAAVAAHDRWLSRLHDLAPAVVIGTRPVTRGERRLNEAFVWDPTEGYVPAHVKRYLPDEEDFWEARWYEGGGDEFSVVGAGAARVGLLVCTELWSFGHAQRYGRASAQVLAIPRATGRSTVEKWVTGGRAAAIVAGAFSVSSNRTAPPGGGDFGGGGWIIDPDGQLLALTSRDDPFKTVDVNLADADAAKATYPRYALD